MRMRLAAVAAGLWLAAGGATAQTQPPPPNDYGKGETWLCRPGRTDACAIDMSATIVGADGAMRREAWARNDRAAVDCFYVYPTVAADPTPNSDMTPGPEERYVAERQLARFGKVCRIFAPLYRQITIPALRALTSGQAVAVDRELAYRDVRDAWTHYLRHDNAGRGVVLYGHSQGAGVLKRLIQEEIDGKPVQARVLSAMLIGTNILVAKGGDAGGDFKSMPLCRSRLQTGCIVTYVSFRESAPPPANSRFGRTDRAGMEVACTNPAALVGGNGVMSPVFGATRVHPTAAPPPPWATPAVAITTPYVRVPGLVSARCVQDASGGYLAWRVNADPKDPRTDTLSGDHLDATGNVQADWGTHSLDVPLAMGDLIDTVAAQAAAWARKR